MTYDFVIVGGGPGGYTAALRAAGAGASVALVEREHLGGVCLNWGCIPTKALLRSGKLLEQMKKAADHGIRCQSPTPDLPAIISRKNKVVAQLGKGLQKLMAARKIEVFSGEGTLSAPDQVSVASSKGQHTLNGKHIILATGAQIMDLPGLACNGKRVLDIKSALDLEWLPRRLLVVGAGVVGCEMAQLFSSLGSQVSLVELLERPLGGMLDPDLEKLVLRSFRKRKYAVHFGTSVQSLEETPGAVIAQLASGKQVEAEAVLVAVGMGPNTNNLGLKSTGVETSPGGHINVDRHSRTSIENIYAVGDVTGIQPLAHFAAHMGSVAVRHALGQSDAVIDQQAVPKAVFLEPELAWVGLTQAEAEERYGAIRVGSYQVRGLGRSAAEGRLDGLVKLVAKAQDGVLVGAHIFAHQADALIAEATLAIAKGLTLHDLAGTIHAHPTYSEGLLECADAALGQPLH